MGGNGTDPARTETFGGIATSRGFAAGPAFVCAGGLPPPGPVRTLAPEETAAEVARYEKARAATREQLSALVRRLTGEVGDEADIFSGHLAMLDDEVVTAAVRRRIADERLDAETAVRRSTEEFRAAFLKMDDPYLRERVRDIDDIERRVLGNLTGNAGSPFAAVTTPVIVIAEDLTPSDTVAMPRALIRGLATDRGGATSHVALLARALGIPCVTGLKNVTARVRNGEKVLLDGTGGALTVRPDAAAQAAFDAAVRRAKRLERILGTVPKATPGALALRYYANVQPGVPLEALVKAGAEGVGLYRTEYLWLAKGGEPSEDEQYASYAGAVRETATLGSEARTVFRVLDIGGDKTIRDATAKPEDNPFLGCRSIRYLLAHRDVFRRQLRAILRASACGKAAVMWPMVAVLEELRAANAELAQAKRELAAAGEAFDARLPCGMMIEIPSAALNAEAFAREVDFFSIGTNDLVQYAMAADRGNLDVMHLHQPTNPAVIRLVEMTCQAAAAADIPVAVCGESASDPVMALLWAGLGVSGLSMNAASIAIVRKTLASFTADEARDAVRAARERSDGTAAAIYGALREAVAAKVPELEEMRALFASAGAAR